MLDCLGGVYAGMLDSVGWYVTLSWGSVANVAMAMKFKHTCT